MSAPRCLVIGAGRMAGGFVAPALRAAGWEVILVSRNEMVVGALNERGGLRLRIAGDPPHDHLIDGVTALLIGDPRLPQVAARADVLATAVGPSALALVGRLLAPLLRERLEARSAPINLLAFENHRRAPELLLEGLVREDASLAREIGRRVGLGGAVVWRTISHRAVTAEGLSFDADAVDECYVDAASLVPGVAPLDGSTPGIVPVRPFDDRIVEKLWLFNAGHATAAYLGWQAGCATVGVAMTRPTIRATVASVVAEAQQALAAHLAARPGSGTLPPRPIDAVLDRYADRRLNDPVSRVAREPRRKLAAGDRLIGPGIACLAAGIRPVAFATAAAVALAYGEPTDPQAVDLQRELALLGPEEVLSTTSTLDPRDELTHLVCAAYRERLLEPVAVAAALASNDQAGRG